VRSVRRTAAGLWRGSLPGAVLTAAFLVVTLLSLGPLIRVDRLLNFAFEKAWPQFDPFMVALAKFGQRGLLLPLLFGLAIFLARRRRTWQPLVITLVSVLTVNFVVGVLKLATARDKPVTGDPMFFEQGVLYPSGHAANAIMYFGLSVFLVRAYGRADGLLARVLLVLTWVACLAQLVALTYLQLHWFTDIVGGLLLGGAVLRSTVYDRGLVRRLSTLAEQMLHRLLGWWRRWRRSRAEEPDRTTAADPPVSGETVRAPASQNGSAVLPVQQLDEPLDQPHDRSGPMHVNGVAPDAQPVRRVVPERQQGE
jgi:membrane-associated phospholipid phosphatase